MSLDNDEAAIKDLPPWPWAHSAMSADDVVGADGYEVAEAYALGSNQTRRVAEHIVRWDPARVLAEVAAKRAIVEMHRVGVDPCDAHDAAFESVPCDTLLALAQPHAGHPDFERSWRVS